jgi:hypothetical protein
MIEELQIDEENPNVQEIMLEIRRTIAHRKSGGWEAQRFGRFDHSVYDHLFQALGTYDQTHVEAFVSPTSIPIIGSLWQRVRQLAHNLVLFYLDRLSEKQIQYNEQLIKTVESVVRSLEAEPQPAAMQTHLAALQEQVTKLEARLAQLDTAEE